MSAIDEDTLMHQAITDLTDATVKYPPYARPDGTIHYCFKNSWRTDPDVNIKMKQIENIVPARFAVVRHFLERHLGLYDAKDTYISARAVSDFERRDLEAFAHLEDDDMLYEDSVVVLYRVPLRKELLNFVPDELIGDFLQWFDEENKRRANAAKKGGRTGRPLNIHHFCTRKFAFRPEGRKPKFMVTGHASGFKETPPAAILCTRCSGAGHYLESCDIVELGQRGANRLKMAHGIPKSELTLVGPSEERAKDALYTDLEGNLYIRKQNDVDLRSHSISRQNPQYAEAFQFLDSNF